MNKLQDFEKRSNLIIISEIIFTLTPILILIILWINDGTINNLLTKPELSFCAIILFGQTIVKFGSGLSKNTAKQNWHFATLIFAFLIVVCLIPSVIFLVLIYKANEPKLGLIIIQTIWFILSISIYFIIGGIGQESLEKNV